MLRTLLTASAVLACAAAPAYAQSSAPSTWTGAYAGLNLGAGVGSFSYPFSGNSTSAAVNPVTGRFRQSSSGGLIGGQLGYDYETRNGLVLGLVTDLDASNIVGNSNFYSLDAQGNANAARLKSQIDALGTVRGRLGLATFNGRLLPYITGGLAYGGVSTTADQICSTCATGGGYASQYANRTGWTVGLGADYALTNHLSLRTEYLYTDLGRQTLSDEGTFSAPGITVDNAAASVNTSANILRVGLNYKF